MVTVPAPVRLIVEPVPASIRRALAPVAGPVPAGARPGGPSAGAGAAAYAAGVRGGDVLGPDTRTLPVRRLSRAEADLLGFAGPLQLSRLQVGRFGWWRNSRWYVIETASSRQVRLTVTGAELRRLGITPPGR